MSRGRVVEEEGKNGRRRRASTRHLQMALSIHSGRVTCCRVCESGRSGAGGEQSLPILAQQLQKWDSGKEISRGIPIQDTLYMVKKEFHWNRG